MGEGTISRAALGRIANLGDLYDARTDTFTGFSMLSAPPPTSCVTTTDSPFSDVQFVMQDSFEEKFEKLNVSGELKLSVLCGFFSLEGSGKYLTDQKKTARTAKVSLVYKIKTVVQTLNVFNSSLLKVISPAALAAVQATHVVTSVGWGADSTVSAEVVTDKKEEVKILEGRLAAELKKIAISISGNAQAGMQDNQTQSLHNMNLKLYGDVVAKDLLPQNIEEALRLMKQMPVLVQQANDGKGRPIFFTMVSLNVLRDHLKLSNQAHQMLTKINEEAMHRYVQLFDELGRARQSLHDLVRDMAAHQYCVSPADYEDANKFRNDTEAAEAELRADLASVLTAVRSGEAGASQLENVRLCFYNGPASPKSISRFMNGYVKVGETMRMADALNKRGVIYVGRGNSLSAVLMEHMEQDIFVLYMCEEHRHKDSEWWNQNWALFHTYLNEPSRDPNKPAVFVCVDCEMVSKAKQAHEKVAVALFRGTKCVSNNLVADAQQTSKWNSAQSKDIQCSKPPNKRNYLEIPCPGSLRGGDCMNDIKHWFCKKCEKELEYGFDGNCYCKCGRAPVASFEFKCCDRKHGNTFVPFNPRDLATLENFLKEHRALKEMNILVLGETGVGKSTWINGFANYLTYASLEEANANGLVCLIPSSFVQIDDDHNEKKVDMKVNLRGIKVEGGLAAAGGENTSNIGESGTQHSRSYVFPYQDGIVRLIDTPGIGDTRGLDQDRENFQGILSHLAYLPEIHGICILLKPNNAKLTVMFRFCITELLTHLHKDACQNIVFVFTNTRSTFFKPGDTLPPLRKLLEQNPNVDIPLSKYTMYCMDNEAVRYLACKQAGIKFNERDDEDFSRSWDRSVQETERLISHIKDRPPHPMQDTLTLNDVRRLILDLTKPLAQIATMLQTNIRVVEDKKAEIDQAIKDRTIVAKDLYVPSMELAVKPIDYQRTVCAAAKCIEMVKDKNGLQHPNYKTWCHDRCYLENVPQGTTGLEVLKGCDAMGGTMNCQKCGCGYENHMHITYETQVVPTQAVDPNIQSLLNRKDGNISAARETIRRLEEEVKDLKEEKEIITEVSSRFACFLKVNAIAAYNDVLDEYLAQLINQEKQKLAAGGTDRRTLEGCEKMRESYGEEKKILEMAMKNKTAHVDLSPAKIKEDIDRLYGLKRSGQNLKNMVKYSQQAGMARAAYQETACSLPHHSKPGRQGNVLQKTLHKAQQFGRRVVDAMYPPY